MLKEKQCFWASEESVLCPRPLLLTSHFRMAPSFVGVDTLLPKCTKVQLLLLTSGRTTGAVIPLFFSQLLFQACLLQLGASNLGPKKLCKLLLQLLSHLFLKPAFTFKGFQNGSHEPDKSSLLRWSLQATKRSISVRDPSLLFYRPTIPKAHPTKRKSQQIEVA